jgi:hypothetical protein
MSLVKGPDVDDFLLNTQLEIGLKLLVGDPKVDAMVGPDITGAQIALKEGAKKVDALPSLSTCVRQGSPRSLV